MKLKRSYKSELRSEQTAATRARIVEAALVGFAPWTTELPFDEVAERARVSVRTVYRHFPTQRDLIDEVTRLIMERADWRPDEITADNLGAVTARAFAYFGTLLDGGQHEPEPTSAAMAELRAKRLATIERVVGPLTEGMDAEQARGVHAVFGGLFRMQFLRAMHEQWGLDGEGAGRAVQWAIDTLLDALRREEER